MKITGTLSFFLLPLALYAGPITQKPLDEFVIYDIPVASKSGTTTVMFPSEISGLFAKSVATQEQENAGFLISFTPGNFYFSIRALKSDAEDHLTVIFNRKAYVLHLKASDQPFYNVTFYQDDRRGKDGGRAAIVPERLLSLMDKAKACVRRHAAEIRHPGVLRNHRQRAGRTQQSRSRQQMERARRACRTLNL